jgi:hypothetical protein
MSYLVLTNDTLSDPADKTEVEANFSDIKTLVNGNISSDNISELDVDKLTGQYYNHLLSFDSVDLSTATTSATGECILIPAGTWTIVSAHWAAKNTGGNTATVQVEEGSWDGSGAFTSTKATSAATISTASGTFTASTFTGTTTGGAGICYRVNVTGNDGTATDLHVTVVLKRKIHT